MAVAAGAVDVQRRAGVDPDLKAVAVFEPSVAAPDRLLLAFDFHVDQQAFGAPGHAHVGESRFAVGGVAVELGQIQQPIRFVELDAGRFPQRIAATHRHGEAEQEPRGQQCVDGFSHDSVR